MIEIPKITNNLIANKYIILPSRILGNGGFGNVFMGKFEDENKKEIFVAIKLESNKKIHSSILSESKIYSIIQSPNSIGIPTIYWSGSPEPYNILIMQHLGNNLGDLLTIAKGGKFSLATVCLIGKQLISRIEYIHSKNIIHRDIKPENFLIGKDLNDNIIYIVDFGLAKRFQDPKTGLHIPYRDGKEMIGTARYASVNTHLGIEQSRRDDLEAIAYLLMFFFKGKLPWQGMKAKNDKDKFNKIREKKMELDLISLRNEYPKEFLVFLQYTRNLRFDQKPDYNYLKKLIRRVQKKENLALEGFDWQLNLNKEDQKEEKQNEEDQKSIN